MEDALPEPRGSGPIVLIDDNRLDLRFARRCHDRSQIARPLLTFSDGSSGMDYLDESLAGGQDAPSLIIVDLMESRSPGPNGLDVIDRIRRMDEGLPVIVMTDSTMPSFRQKAGRLGCSAYIPKPTLLRDLVSMFAAFGP